MANYERDKEDVRVFDGGEDDDDGEGSHLPVVIIIAILVLAAFGGVVWLAYNQGVARGRGDAQPRIAAMNETSKGDGSGLKVYQQPAAGEDEDNAAPKQAAPAATPAQAAPQPAPEPAPAAVPAAQPAPAPVKTDPAPVKAAQQPAPAPVKVAQAAPAKPTLTQAAPTPASSTPSVATKPPAQLGLAHPAPVAATPPAPAKTAVTAPVKQAPATTSAPVKAVAAKPAPAGSYFLQIGAYRSEAEAMTAWKTYQSKHATLLSGLGPDVQKADLGDKGVWYRLRIATAADKDAAAALCDRLKAQNAACFLAH